MAARPPHVLVTTPESAFILLTSASGRRALSGVRTVILDEVHAIAGDKRGAHLALSLERLEDLVVGQGGACPQRVGLSATVRPIEIAARLVAGARELPRRSSTSGSGGDLDLAIEVPRDELGAVVHERAVGARSTTASPHSASGARSTLVFVNTRRLVERRRAPRSASGSARTCVAAHHGSLSRARRLVGGAAAQGRGSSASSSRPRRSSSASTSARSTSPASSARRGRSTSRLQRIGRSGHALGRDAAGAALPARRATSSSSARRSCARARRGELDRMTSREGPLDVLAQQIIAACACEERDEEGLLALVRRAAPYAALRAATSTRWWPWSRAAPPRRTRARPPPVARGQRAGSLVYRDAIGGRLRGRRGARLAALTSGGAIPDIAGYRRGAPARRHQGRHARRGFRDRVVRAATCSCWATPRGG